jgi:hypothetical protein
MNTRLIANGFAIEMLLGYQWSSPIWPRNISGYLKFI